MKFKRPFRVELSGTDDIWVLDADGSFVTRFPRTSADIAVDLERARVIASSNTEDIEEGQSRA